MATHQAILEGLSQRRKDHHVQYDIVQELVEQAASLLSTCGTSLYEDWVSEAQYLDIDPDTIELLVDSFDDLCRNSINESSTPKKSDFERKNGKLVWKSNGKPVSHLAITHLIKICHLPLYTVPLHSKTG